MKKIFYLILCVLGVCLVSCCSKPSLPKKNLLTEWMEPSEKIKVLSTTAIIEDLVKEIGGERVLSMPLIKGELDPHSYELVKGDMEKLSSADLIFYNGLELEHGASLKHQLEKSSRSYSLGENLVSLKKSENLIFYQGQVDPHIWMDLSLFSFSIDFIKEKLCQLSPEYEDEFETRALNLKKEFEALDKKIIKMMQEIPQDQRYLVTAHDSFFYFTKRYLATEQEREKESWMERVIAPEGLAPDGQISSKDIKKIVDFSKNHRVKVFFKESNVSADALNKVVLVLKEQDIVSRLAFESLYADALGDKNSKANSYLKMMESNARVIFENLMGNHDGK